MEKITSTVGEVYLLNPLNKAVLDGESKIARSILPSNSWLLWLLPVFSVVFFYIFANMVWEEFQHLAENRQLNASGMVIEGTVLARRETNIRSRTKAYYIEYGYRLENESYSGEARVSLADYTRATEEAPALVRYLPSNPSVSRLVESQTALISVKPNYFILFGGGAASIFSLVILFAFLYVLYRDRVVAGKVKQVEVRQSGRTTVTLLHYAIQTRGIEGAYPIPNNNPFRDELKKGLPLAIWYADDKTHQPL